MVDTMPADNPAGIVIDSSRNQPPMKLLPPLDAHAPNPLRRTLLKGVGALAAIPLIGVYSRSHAAITTNPFTLGVASGDPVPDGFVLWTRLAPQPISPDGLGGMAGMPAHIPVQWEVARDESMRDIVQRGVADAPAHFAYSVHVEVEGLEPQRPYWYRFTTLGAQSAVGRAQTAPRAGAPVDKLKFSFASCSHWELGYFGAYRHMADEHPDLVVFLGDYIYDYTNDPQTAKKKLVRHHDGPNALDIVGYRNRYALYRTDADLQRLHAVAPCLMTWDDHEVENDYAGQWAQDPKIPVEAFLMQRAQAYQAFYEHFPLRAMSIPNGPDMRVYDRAKWGSLVDFHVLDGRQYRSVGACGSPNFRGGHIVDASCTERVDPKRTMLGFEQETWLYDGFRQSRAQWNVIAQDVLVAPLVQQDRKSDKMGAWTDAWDGYPACRERMLQALVDTKASNPVFVGGDIHSYWTTDLRTASAGPESEVVATEFVGTSVTADSPPYDVFAKILPLNPHVKYFESRAHGYVSVEVTPQQMLTKYQAISDRTDRNATVSTLKSFVVESGVAGAKDA